MRLVLDGHRRGKPVYLDELLWKGSGFAGREGWMVRTVAGGEEQLAIVAMPQDFFSNSLDAVNRLKLVDEVAWEDAIDGRCRQLKQHDLEARNTWIHVSWRTVQHELQAISRTHMRKQNTKWRLSISRMASYHRNGIGGVGFTVILFDDERKTAGSGSASLLDEPGVCACLLGRCRNS